MRCESVGKISSLKYKLREKTLENISKSTKLNKDELVNLSLDEQLILMKNRGAIKKPNPIRVFFAETYKKLGEKLGFLKKEPNIYTDID